MAEKRWYKTEELLNELDLLPFELIQLIRDGSLQPHSLENGKPIRKYFSEDEIRILVSALAGSLEEIPETITDRLSSDIQLEHFDPDAFGDDDYSQLTDFLSKLVFKAEDVKAYKGCQSKEDGLISDIRQEQCANIFRQSGAVWNIRYKGNEAHVRALEGVRHIARLLESKGASIPVHDMVGGGVRDGEEPTDPEWAAANDLSMPGSVRITNARANKLLWDKYYQLQEDLQSPEFGLEEKEEKEEEAKKCLDAIKRSEEAERKSRTQAGLNRGRQAAVKRAIQRAITAMAKIGPLEELAQHLEKNIRPSGNYTYRYTGELAWDIFWQD